MDLCEPGLACPITRMGKDLGTVLRDIVVLCWGAQAHGSYGGAEYRLKKRLMLTQNVDFENYWSTASGGRPSAEHR